MHSFSRDAGPPGLRIVHVTRTPPSPSGIALYAVAFRAVLAATGTVRTLGCPPDPADAQRLGAAVRGFARGLLVRTRDVDVVHVELGGRGLHEFYLVLGLLLRRRRPWVAVTCHDLPSLVGPALLVRLLDRRGGRRLGLRLSATLGARWERRLLGRVDSLFALTAAGADVLTRRSGRPAHALPHVVDEPAPVAKSRQVFVPGYVDATDTLVGLARVVHAAGAGWTTVIGSCPPQVATQVAARVGDATVRFTGRLDEATLLRTFAESSVVVRVAGAHAGNALAASGPLAWALARGCVCVTNDARAGAAELAAAGLITRTDDLAAALAAALRGCAPSSPEPVDRVRARFGVAAVAAAYQAALAGDAAARRP